MAPRASFRTSALPASLLLAMAASTSWAAEPASVQVEPVSASAEPAADMPVAIAPRCSVPRLQLAYADRTRLAEEQAARLAAESQAARAAAAQPQGPVRLQPAEPAASSDDTTAPSEEPLRSSMPVAPMDPNMAAVLDQPAEPQPAVLLPGYDLSPQEAEAAYACILPELPALYGASGHALAERWASWERLEQPPILVPDALGMRWLVVHGNERVIKGRPLEGYMDREFVVGATLGMPSFTVAEDGTVSAGPLYIVEKMQRGYSGPYGNWRFTEIPTESRDIRPQISRGGTGATEPVICANCTARGLDAVYLTLVHGGTAPAPDALPPLRDLQRPASWYKARERSPRQDGATEEPGADKMEPAAAEPAKPVEEPAPMAPDATPPVTSTSMRG